LASKLNDAKLLHDEINGEGDVNRLRIVHRSSLLHYPFHRYGLMLFRRSAKLIASRNLRVATMVSMVVVKEDLVA